MADGFIFPSSAAPAAAPAPAANPDGFIFPSGKQPAAAPKVAVPKTATPSPFTSPLFGTGKVNLAQPFQAPGANMSKKGAPDNSLGGVVKNTIEGLPAAAGIQQPFTAKSFNPNDWLQAGWENLSSTVQDAGSKLSDAVDTAKDQHASALEKGVAAGEAGLGTLNSLFTIITAPMAVIQKIPVVGYLADGVNDIFSALGSGGKNIAEGTLDKLPISDSAKKTLKPLVGQLGSLAGQLIAGKAGGEILPEIAEKGHEVVRTVTEAAKDPETLHMLQEHHAPVEAVHHLPVKEAPNTLFPKSTGLADVKTTKPIDMHPTLRTEIRDNLDQHGPLATHAALQTELGLTDSQARVHMREAPVPQSAAEEMKIHNDTLRQVLLKAPEDKALLTEPKQATALLGEGKKGNSIQGEGFTATDKADPVKVAAGKARNDYREAVSSFSKNPTPTKLAKVRAARAAMDKTLLPLEESKQTSRPPVSAPAKKSLNQPVVSKEIVNAPKTVVSEQGAPGVLKPVESAGDVEKSTLAAKVEANVVKKKLSATLGDTPQYAKTSWDEQATKSVDLINKDPEKALRIATGEEAPPSDVLAGSVFTAIEERATRSGDVETLRKLAQGSASGQFTRFGQEIGSLSQRSQDGAVAKISEVSKAREAAFEKTSGKKTTDAIKETIDELKEVRKKSTPTKQDWGSFIKSLQC